MPVASLNSYNLSFTAASLRPELARILAEHYLVTGNWNATKEAILASNALQCRTVSSAVRLERELRQRLQTLVPDQVALLSRSTSEDRAAMTWLGMLKYNALVFDFAAEVLRDKLAANDFVLRPSDYESFFDAKTTAHPELAIVTESTRTKVRRVLLRMLSEAGLLARGLVLGTVQRPVLSPNALRVIRADHPRWLAGFLVPDAEIARA